MGGGLGSHLAGFSPNTEIRFFDDFFSIFTWLLPCFLADIFSSWNCGFFYVIQAFRLMAILCCVAKKQLPRTNGPFGAPMQNGQHFWMSLQCLFSSWSKNCKWGHSQNVKVLTAYLLIHTQVNIFGFTFLDLLIKLMKIMLLYILYCPPPHPQLVISRIF